MCLVFSSIKGFRSLIRQRKGKTKNQKTKKNLQREMDDVKRVQWDCLKKTDFWQDIKLSFEQRNRFIESVYKYYVVANPTAIIPQKLVDLVLAYVPSLVSKRPLSKPERELLGYFLSSREGHALEKGDEKVQQMIKNTLRERIWTFSDRTKKELSRALLKENKRGQTLLWDLLHLVPMTLQAFRDDAVFPRLLDETFRTEDERDDIRRFAIQSMNLALIRAQEHMEEYAPSPLERQEPWTLERICHLPYENFRSGLVSRLCKQYKQLSCLQDIELEKLYRPGGAGYHEVMRRFPSQVEKQKIRMDVS
jgi:hypothetical protein